MLSLFFDICSIEMFDDRLWMYRDLPQGLWMMDYCNGVQGFINYAISNPININGDGIRCPCKRCKNKKNFDPDVVMMHHLQKIFMKEYMCWYAHGELFVSHETMLERILKNINSKN